MAGVTVTAEDSADFSDVASVTAAHTYSVEAFDSFGFIEEALGVKLNALAADSADFTDAASASLYLGRYRRGDLVGLAISTAAVPDGPPVVVVMDSVPTQILAATMPATNLTRQTFVLPVLLGIDYPIGSFTVYYHYSIDGASTLQQGSFDVIPGGDSGGAVISMYSLDRAESRSVVAQLAGGQLVLGRNPATT
jgi:hypothetical protein